MASRPIELREASSAICRRKSSSIDSISVVVGWPFERSSEIFQDEHLPGKMPPDAVNPIQELLERYLRCWAPPSCARSRRNALTRNSSPPWNASFSASNAAMLPSIIAEVPGTGPVLLASPSAPEVVDLAASPSIFTHVPLRFVRCFVMNVLKLSSAGAKGTSEYPPGFLSSRVALGRRGTLSPLTFPRSVDS